MKDTQVMDSFLLHFSTMLSRLTWLATQTLLPSFQTATSSSDENTSVDEMRELDHPIFKLDLVPHLFRLVARNISCLEPKYLFHLQYSLCSLSQNNSFDRCFHHSLFKSFQRVAGSIDALVDIQDEFLKKIEKDSMELMHDVEKSSSLRSQQLVDSLEAKRQEITRNTVAILDCFRFCCRPDRLPSLDFSLFPATKEVYERGLELGKHVVELKIEKIDPPAPRESGTRRSRSQ